jgi:hypothetical protein
MTTEPLDAPQPASIHIFVVSHTNVGKTALVRTLLGKDVGEVEDAPDVTQTLADYELAADEALGRLHLWDTPGFGDSFRLAGRLRRKNRALAWLVREVWDRWRNPALWRGQRLALDLRARASVVLYPVNLLERPVDAVYVAPELDILTWTGKPVLVLLNQGGGLPDPGAATERISEWRRHLAAFPAVQQVLALDGYTRCWLQELSLFQAIGQLLPPPERPAYRQLTIQLGQGYRDRFEASAAALADYLIFLSGDRVEMERRWFDGLKDAWAGLRARTPWGHAAQLTPLESGLQGLAQRYAEKTRQLTDTLIAIHRLDGVSAAEIMEMAHGQLAVQQPVDAPSSAVAGGVISGILTGLGADLMTGGLSLGTGALVGGVMGALGAAALAQGYNVYTQKDKKVVCWSTESLTQALTNAAMLYLSVAHFGRGQGPWRRKESPQEWADAVQTVLRSGGERLARLWPAAASEPGTPEAHRECKDAVQELLRDVLLRLYPESGAVLPLAGTAAESVQRIDPPEPLERLP